MSLVLQGSFGSVVAAWSWEPPAAGARLALGDRIAARAWLSGVAARPGEMARLRRLVAERHVVPGYGLDDGEVVDRLAGWVAAGELRLWERARGPLATWGEGEALEEAPAASDARPPAVELTWITIRLVGEDDEPIPNERYRVELPDGSTREGRLDHEGKAHLTGIEPGDCEVTFPDLDEEAWVPIGQR